MTSDQFIAHVAQRTGVPQGLEAIEAVLVSLGECLSRAQAEALADELPRELASLVRDSRHNQNLDRFDVESRVAQRTGLSRGAALEWMFAVGRTVAESVRDDVLALIRRDLPGDLAALLEAVEPYQAPQGVHRDPLKRTLAEAGPLSDARPESAQSQSVVRSDNPHGDTKLSSTQGIAQEREGRTIATTRK
jgi:uncharacterized protein (DUF2267 family)